MPDSLESPISPSMENYLKAICQLEERSERATTSALAERLEVSAASVTGMLRRLASLRLIEHEPYQGASLTPSGRRIGIEVIRHHRIIETYLAETLGVPWDRVHEEAEKLEHVLSEDLEERMARAIGDRTVDPHGSPIPSKDGAVSRPSTRPLSEVAAGGAAVVCEVDDRDPEFLRYLGERGILPSTRLVILDVEPYGGALVLKVGEAEHRLGAEAAARIHVADETAATDEGGT